MTQIELLGNTLKVKKTKDKINHVSYSNDQLLVQFKEKTAIETLIQAFVKSFSKDVFKDVLVMLMVDKKIETNPFPRLRIQTLKTAWYRTSNSTITFHKDLITCPLAFIEYIVCIALLDYIKKPEMIDQIMPDHIQRKSLVK